MRSPLATVVLWLTIPLMAVGMLTFPLFEEYWIRWGWVVVAGLVIAVVYRPPLSVSVLRFLQREFLVAAIGSALLIAACLSGIIFDRAFQLGPWVLELHPGFYCLHEMTGSLPLLDVPFNVVEWSSACVFLTFVCLLLMLAYAIARRVVQMRDREQNHLCLECGYNLTGNVSGVCPECGIGVGTKAS